MSEDRRTMTWQWSWLTDNNGVWRTWALLCQFSLHCIWYWPIVQDNASAKQVDKSIASKPCLHMVAARGYSTKPSQGTLCCRWLHVKILCNSVVFWPAVKRDFLAVTSTNPISDKTCPVPVYTTFMVCSDVTFCHVPWNKLQQHWFSSFHHFKS